MDAESNRRVGILQAARLASKRVPQKLLAEVGGERLIDRGLRYLVEICAATGATPVLTVARQDSTLIECARQHAVDVCEIPETSSEGETWRDV